MMLLKALVFILLSLTVSGEYFYFPSFIHYNHAVYVCKQNGLQLVNVKTNETQRLVSAYMSDWLKCHHVSQEQILFMSREQVYVIVTISYIPTTAVLEIMTYSLEVNLRDVDLWAGLHYNASMSKFQWGDGEILHSPGVLSWQGGQPDLSQGMKCVVMNPSYGPFIYNMSECNAHRPMVCVGEETLDLPKVWPSIVRYTKRFCESNQDGYPECVFERYGVSGQIFSYEDVDAVEDCALTCKYDKLCLYFNFLYLAKLKGTCIIHKQIPG